MFFLINYILHCSKCSSRLCFQLLQNVRRAENITYVVRTCKGINRAKTAPSYRCCDHGDISFLLYFWKRCLVRNITNIFKRKIVLQRLLLGNRLRAPSYEPGNRAGSVTGTFLYGVFIWEILARSTDEIQETQPKWWNINFYCIYSRNFRQ